MTLRKNSTSASATSLQQAPPEPSTTLSLLGIGIRLDDTLNAHEELVHCLQNATSNATPPTATASPEVCAEEQAHLQGNFTKAYIAIKKMTDSYDDARNDTTCDQGVE